MKNFFTQPPIEINDPVFGKIKKHKKEMWYGEIPFDFELTGNIIMNISIDADENGPGEEQRKLFIEIKQKYIDLWADISQALLDYHVTLDSIEKVNKHVEDINLGIDPITDTSKRRWNLQYTFDLDTEGDMSYFVEFEEWKILKVWVMD